MVSTMLLSLACLLLFFLVAEGGVGVGWSRQTSQKLLPSMIVDMILADGIQKVRLFSSDTSLLSAFVACNNVDVMITKPNAECVNDPKWEAFYQKKGFTSSTTGFVRENIADIIEQGVRITHLLVGNEAENATVHNNVLVPCLKDLQEAIDGDTKLKKMNKKVIVSMPHWIDILEPGIEKPSQADFREDVKEHALEYLKILRNHDGPFIINLYPLWDIRQNNFPLEFGFFDGNKDFTTTDGNVVYDNVFDFTFDKFVWALKNNGFEGMKIIVGSVGWPTDGDIYANISTAKRFHQGLLNKTADKKGTPLYPGPLELYIYSFVDENDRTLQFRGPTERHYGIYNYDGTPKFNIDFTLQKRKDVQLEPAKGVDRMPNRWCVFNDITGLEPTSEELMAQFNHICSKADCTKLSPGGSCSGLDFKGNISYAYNMYFQRANQEEVEHCDWNGSGAIIAEDPSTEECKFPLQILATIFGNSGEMATTLATGNVRGRCVMQDFGMLIGFQLFSLVFFVFLL